MVDGVFFEIYLLIIAGVAFFQLFLFFNLKSKKIYDSRIDKGLLLLFLAILTLFVGLRGEEVGSDTFRYIADFNYIKGLDFFDYDFLIARSSIARDPFFVVFSFYLGRLFDAGVYIFLISTLFYGLFYFVICNTVKRMYLAHLLSFLVFIFFLSLGVNIIRSGLSIMMILFGFSAMIKDSNLTSELKLTTSFWAWAFVVVGVLMHSASLILVACLLIGYFVRLNSKYFLLLLLFSLFLAFFKFSISDFPVVGVYFAENERLSIYLSSEASQPPSGVTIYVFVFQFLLVLYYYLQAKSIRKNSFYNLLFNVYLLLSSFYMFCLNISFSDRFGLYSWVMMPFLLTYPVSTKGGDSNKNIVLYLFFCLIYFLLMLYRMEVND